jgi:hypothetical protein
MLNRVTSTGGMLATHPPRQSSRGVIKNTLRITNLHIPSLDTIPLGP